MVKMAAMPIYDKNTVKIFSRTKGPKALGIGMQHWVHEPSEVWKNDKLGLTVTFLRKGQEKSVFFT